MACLEYLDARMQGLDDLSDLGQVRLRDKIDLVDDKSRAELDLLDQEALDVLLLDLVLLQEVLSARELVDKTCGINNAHDIVELSVLDQLKLLRDRHGLADSGCLDQDVVIFSGLDQFLDVGCHLALQGAADASVCKRHDVTCVSDVSALCDQ